MAERSFVAPINYAALPWVLRHSGQYHAIWEILGWEWNGPLHAAARAINEIHGMEHGTLHPDFQLRPEQRQAILEQLYDMGWFDGLPLEPGLYGNGLLMGAKYQAMRTRAQSLLKRLSLTDRGQAVRFRRQFGLFGQRPRTDQLDGTAAAIFANLREETQNHPWVREQMALMERRDAYDLWGGAFATEFELGILALLDASASEGEVAFRDYELCRDNTSLPGVPPRTVNSVTLVLPNGSHLVAVNAPAVERPGKPPRPTSDSVAQHWLKHYDVESGDMVVVVTVRVHGRRMLGDIERRIHSIEPGVNVFGYAEIVDEPEKFFNHALGEASIMLVKAVGELLATLSSPGTRAPLDQQGVRQYLDELYRDPTNKTRAHILERVVWS